MILGRDNIYGKGFKEGDIIKLIIDRNQKTISWQVNKDE